MTVPDLTLEFPETYRSIGINLPFGGNPAIAAAAARVRRAFGDKEYDRRRQHISRR